MFKAPELFRVRHHSMRFIRQFFDHRDFIEIEAPILVTSPGTEPYLHYFESTWLDPYDRPYPLFLRSSPELHLKQALCTSQIAKVYHLGPSFRNRGEKAPWHHPEFCLLEWYEQGQDLRGLMSTTEEFVRRFANWIEIGLDLEAFALPKTFKKLSIYECFQEYAGLELHDLDPDLGKKAWAKKLPAVNKEDDFHAAYFKILLNVIEPHFKELGAIIAYDYPPSQAALAKITQARAQRFELYINGIEIANAFEELGSKADNLKRIEESNHIRATMGVPEIPLDQDFFRALELGGFKNPTSGIALGVDRLLAVLLRLQNLSEVLPFAKNGTYPEPYD